LTYDVPLGLCFASAVFSFLPVSGMGLVNPEGYIALSLFPHLSVLSHSRSLGRQSHTEPGQ
jgi:hypothetical protein